MARRVRGFAGVRFPAWRRGLTVATATVAAGVLMVPFAVAQDVPQYHYAGKVWSPSPLPKVQSVPVKDLNAKPTAPVLAKGQKALTTYQAAKPTWPTAGATTVTLTHTVTTSAPSSATSADATSSSPTPGAHLAASPSSASAAPHAATTPTTARTQTVPVTGPVKAGTLPVWITPKPAKGQSASATVPAKVRVQVASHAQSLAAGADGLVLSLARADGQASKGPVQVSVDYSSLAKAYGGGFGARLQLVQIPACALTTPQVKACRTRTSVTFTNSASTEQLTATVNLASPGITGALAPALSSKALASVAADQAQSATTLAVTSTPAGSQGNYAATSLNPSGTWQASGTGAFTYSYPIDVPAAVGGSAPSVGFSYDSQAVDGETSARNAQSTWIGDGWSYEPGFVEQSYRSCGSLLDSSGNKILKGSGDKCWDGDNATISFGSHSGTLVPTATDPTVSGEIKAWRLQGDDGTVVQELSGAANGLQDGIYYRVLTPDGSAAYFGSDHAPTGVGTQAGLQSGTPLDASTNSAWGVPVLHPVSGDPCYTSAKGKASQCDKPQGWRWNLDFTVTPTGFVQRYDYTTDSDYYDLGVGQAATGDTGTLTKYTRGGALTQISYGYTLQDELAGHTPAARVVFSSAQRCQQASGFDCSAALSDSTATHWPDVPYDLHCDSTDSTTLPSDATTVPANVCLTSSPTFWSSTRLDSVTTQVHVIDPTTHADKGLVDVDNYQLGQVYSDAGGIQDPVTGSTANPEQEGGLQAVMWLQSIQHTGKDTYNNGNSNLSVNRVTFTGVEINNRVDGLAPAAPELFRPRIAAIHTESGEAIGVTYYPPDCSRVNATMPSSPDSDTMSCYQVYWTTPGAALPIADWFNKTRVQTVAVSDTTGATQDKVGNATVYSGSPAQISTYAYTGPAWHRDDSAQADDQYRTWDQFRGYHTVTVTTGTAPDPITQQVTTYLQGMDGDYKADGTQRSVTVNAVYGGTVTEGTPTTPVVHGSPIQSGGTVVASVKDSNWLAGTPLETDSYTKASGIIDPAATGGTINAESINSSLVTTQTAAVAQTAWTDWTQDDHPGDTKPTLSTLPDLVARRIQSSEVLGFALLANHTWRKTQADTAYDSQARVSTVHSLGDTSDPIQESCTTTTYAATSARNPMMLDYPDQVTSVHGDCAAPTKATLLSDKEVYYDGTLTNLGTFGQLDQAGSSAPAAGQVTATRTATQCATDGSETWQTISAMSYDGAGRVVEALDTNGQPTNTTFSPEWSTSGGNTNPVSMLSSNVKSWQISSTLDPLRGLPLEDKDANGRVTDITYDALGRRTAVWLPGRNQATQSADMTFSYQVQSSAPSTVTTNTLREDGTYAQSITLYDGMLQPRQIQTSTADGSQGRLITDTFYDTHGWAVRSFAPYVDTANPPSTTMAVPLSETQIPSESVTGYDGQGRATNSQLYTMGTAQWSSSTSYPGADETDNTPPAGGPTKSSFTNALGQTTKTLVQNAASAVTLTGGQIIPSGTSLTSDSVRLEMRADGNLVLTSLSTGAVLWTTGLSTSSPGAWAQFTTTGNLVVKSPTGTQLWASGTGTTTGAVLKLGNDSTLGIYPSSTSTTATWSKGTAGAVPAANSTTLYTYTPAGQVSTISDAAGNQWNYTYNLLGQETSQSDPNTGTSTTDSYDKVGNVLQATDARGQKLGYTYDWDNRPTFEYDLTKASTETTDNELASWTYDQTPNTPDAPNPGNPVLGYPSSSTRYVGGAGSSGKAYSQAVSAYNTAYQAMGTTTTIPAADGFAPAGATSAPTSGTVTYTSNATYSPNIGQLQDTIYGADGGLPAEDIGYGYNPGGLVDGTGSVLTASNGTKSDAYYLDFDSYTPLGQLIRSTYGLYGKQLVTTAGYDQATGRMLTSTTNTQTSTTNAIDSYTYRYNQAGELTALSDAESNGGAVTGTDTQCFTYDSFQRLTQAWSDTAGLTTAGVGGTGGCNTTTPTTTATQPIKTTTVGGPAPYWQTYTYDLLGDRTGMVNHDTTGNALANTTQATAYPGTNGTTPATRPDQATSTTTSNPSTGSTTQTPGYTDTSITTSGVNAGNTMTRTTAAGPLSSGLKSTTTATAGQTLCASNNGTTTTAGTNEIVSPCTNATPETYTLGSDGTLRVLGKCVDTAGSAKTAGTKVVINTCPASPTATQKWKASTTGTLVNTGANLCLTDPAANTANGTILTIAACGATGQTWTAPGGTTPGTTQTLAYDAEGRTTTVTTTTGATSNTSSYLYDASGDLLEQTSTVDGTPTTRILYLFGGAEQITLNVHYSSWTALRNYAGPDGTTLTRTSAGTLTYQVPNAQGTAETAIDASTLAVTRRYYDPYGNTRGTKPTTWISPDENHGFLGQSTDTSTGLDLLGARNYDPVQGRFLSRDPVFEAGDPNQMGGYTYAGDNPASSSDPTGLYDPDGPTGTCTTSCVNAGAPTPGAPATGGPTCHYMLINPCGANANPGITLPRAHPPVVANSKLRDILSGIYARADVPDASVEGDGKLGTAVIEEFNTGIPVKGKWHTAKAASSMSALTKLLEQSRKEELKTGHPLLSAQDKLIAERELKELWVALNSDDINGAATLYAHANPEIEKQVKAAKAAVIAAPSASEITGQEFELQGDRMPRPVAVGEPERLTGFLKTFGVAGDVLAAAQWGFAVRDEGFAKGTEDTLLNMIDPLGTRNYGRAQGNPAGYPANVCVEGYNNCS